MSEPIITSERRLQKFKEIASSRLADVTVVLENVHDPHNIGAILRSCDSIGIDRVYILDTDPRLINRTIENKGSSTGISKWIQKSYYTDLTACVEDVKNNYNRLVGTVLGDDSISLYEIQLCDPVALVFGNEKDGVSPELQKHLDSNMTIPQVGFAHSLNVSVACAVSLYELFRQRQNNARPSTVNPINNEIYRRYIEIDKSKRLRKPN